MICMASSKSHSMAYQNMNLKWCLTNQEGRGRGEWSSDREFKTALSQTIAISSPSNYSRCLEGGGRSRWDVWPHPRQLFQVINSLVIKWWPSICREGGQLEDEDKVAMVPIFIRLFKNKDHKFYSYYLLNPHIFFLKWLAFFVKEKHSFWKVKELLA